MPQNWWMQNAKLGWKAHAQPARAKASDTSVWQELHNNMLHCEWQRNDDCSSWAVKQVNNRMHSGSLTFIMALDLQQLKSLFSN